MEPEGGPPRNEAVAFIAASWEGDMNTPDGAGGWSSMATPSDVVVLIPCYNEADTVAQVVGGFREALPEARIVVYDNDSDDGTADVARAAGAEVRREASRGKGHVVRRMFADVDAGVYVLVDGDATYDAPSAPALIGMLLEQRLDMVVARRCPVAGEAYRPGHRFGNRLLSGAVRRMFGDAVRDVLSGYRVFSRRFVKSFPGRAEAFEIEAELTIHALELRLPAGELDTPYYPRPDDSHSKLDTWRDGFLISSAIMQLFVLEHPLRLSLGLALALFTAASILFVPVLGEYLHTGLVPRLPTLVVAVGGYVLAFVGPVIGVILHAVSVSRREAKRLAYLACDPSPDGTPEG